MIIPLAIRHEYDHYKHDKSRRNKWLRGECLDCREYAYPHSRCDKHRKYQMVKSDLNKLKRKAEGRCYNCGRDLMEFFKPDAKLCPVCIINLDRHKKG